MSNHPKLAAIAPMDSCWAIEERQAKELAAWIARCDPQQADEKGREAIAAAKSRRDEGESLYQLVGETAVISIEGPMTKKPTSMSWLFGGCSTIEVRESIKAALNDDIVKRILLYIDSPGGQVAGTQQLADDVAEADLEKPVIAFIEDMGASAAYWVASQARQVFTNKTGTVGSIGTYMVLDDTSKMYEDAGVKVHVISTGDHKGAGVDGAPITEEQLAEFKRYVLELNSHFLTGVAKGREMSMDDVRAVADGRVFVGKQAQKLGLVDGISSFDQLLSRMQSGRLDAQRPAATAGTSTGETMATEKPSLMDRLKAIFQEEGIDTNAAGVVATPPAATIVQVDNPETAKALADAKAQIAELSAGKQKADAESFVNKALASGFLPCVKAEIGQLHLLCQQVEAGQKLEPGALMSALDAFVAKQPETVLTKEQMKEVTAGAVALAPEDAPADVKLIAEAREQGRQYAAKTNGKAGSGKETK